MHQPQIKYILLFWGIIFSANLFAQNTNSLPPKPFLPIPSSAQLQWQEMEMYCIIHFGLATYADKEWGYGDEDPKSFTAPDFNASQIVNAARAGGFRGIIVVAKHHDGFCIWPSATTDHNISQASWKNGKGDMVREYQLAAVQAGMKMGIYCSPWDRNNLLYGKPEYVTEVYQKQLKELYSNYGQLFMSWHDGANGGDGYYGGNPGKRQIDRTTYYAWDSIWSMARKMQPTANIFGDIGPDIRWVGNEKGFAGETHWATYTPQAPEKGKLPANGFSKYEESTVGTRNGRYWMPAECDVPLRPGWFFHASQDGQSKSPHQLLDLYFKSVGRGACLDLGISPDKRGLLADEDVAILKKFGELLKQIFSVNRVQGATIQASNIRGNNAKAFGTSFLTDNDRYTYWATDDPVCTPQLLITLPSVVTFNIIRLRENIKLGQRIEGLVVDDFQMGHWVEIARATSIGANRLIRLSKAVSANKLRIRITASPVCIALSDIGLFLEPIQLSTPLIRRDHQGMVSILDTGHKGEIYYTLDGRVPDTTSMHYTRPFLLTDGGMVKAICIGAKSEFSDVSTKVFGFTRKSWKIKASTPAAMQADLTKALDDNEKTYYSTLVKAGDASAFPQEITVDMGELKTIHAFTYLPRQDKIKAGIVDRYTFMVSTNGENWEQAAAGEFSNIQSNPIEQIIPVGPLPARYFKFIAKHVISGQGIAVAELGCR